MNYRGWQRKLVSKLREEASKCSFKSFGKEWQITIQLVDYYGETCVRVFFNIIRISLRAEAESASVE